MIDIAASIDCLKELFSEQAHAENARSMAAYMKDNFPFHGLKAPVRRAAQKEVVAHMLESDRLEETFIHALWDLPQREYQLVAVDYVCRAKRHWKPEHLRLFQWMISTKSWWDTVDLIATTAVGGLLKKYPALQEVMPLWNEEKDIWLIRTSILYQLKYKQDTDFDLLKAFILRHASSKEFFINKASGWALRQYSKTDPEAVSQFISDYDLPALTVREGRKYLV